MKHKRWTLCCAAIRFGLTTPLTLAQEKEPEQPLQEVFQTRLVYPQERGEVQLSYTSRFSQ